MIVAISPALYNVGETLCSLNFASRCRNIELGQAKKQVTQQASGDTGGVDRDHNNTNNNTTNNSLSHSSSTNSLTGMSHTSTNSNTGGSRLPPSGSGSSMGMGAAGRKSVGGPMVPTSAASTTSATKKYTV